MHTYQIAEAVLDNYRKGQLSDERLDFLKAQADEQLAEISRDAALHARLLKKVNAPETVDDVILWILLMSDEAICEDYIAAFKKPYREMIPVSDLADLLLYAVHLKKVEGVTLDGFDELLAYEHDGKDEVDHYCFTNVLLFVQRSKETEMEF